MCQQGGADVVAPLLYPWTYRDYTQFEGFRSYWKILTNIRRTDTHLLFFFLELFIHIVHILPRYKKKIKNRNVCKCFTNNSGKKNNNNNPQQFDSVLWISSNCLFKWTDSKFKHKICFHHLSKMWNFACYILVKNIPYVNIAIAPINLPKRSLQCALVKKYAFHAISNKAVKNGMPLLIFHLSINRSELGMLKLKC